MVLYIVLVIVRSHLYIIQQRLIGLNRFLEIWRFELLARSFRSFLEYFRLLWETRARFIDFSEIFWKFYDTSVVKVQIQMQSLPLWSLWSVACLLSKLNGNKTLQVFRRLGKFNLFELLVQDFVVQELALGLTTSSWEVLVYSETNKKEMFSYKSFIVLIKLGS